MSSKRRKINWPPKRTIRVGEILSKYQESEIMEIPTEDSYRVNQNEQRGGIGE